MTDAVDHLVVGKVIVAFEPNELPRLDVLAERSASNGVDVSIRSGTTRSTIRAGQVVTCTGLHGERLARQADESVDEKIMPFRGENFELTDERSHLVNGLIYPVPDPAFPRRPSDASPLRLVPEITSDDLVRFPAGMRAQAIGGEIARRVLAN